MGGNAAPGVVVCVPVTGSGEVDPRWGRAGRVAVARLAGGDIAEWAEYEVSWDRLHDTGTEGSHHARVVRFLREHAVDAVAASHMGPGMLHTLDRMGLRVVLGASGDARAAARSGGTCDVPAGGLGH